MSRLDEFKKRSIQEQNQELEKWQREREKLEQRTKEYIDISLDSGAINKGENTISILKRLPEDLEELFADFMKKWRDSSQDPNISKTEKEKLNDEFYEWLAVLCQNPLLTADYFRNNKDKFSSEDMVMIIFSYYSSMAKRVSEKIQEVEIRTKVRNFREQ
ncbi:MAG: hypothetical protein HXS43_11975 [Theionarchaea archaeon]|nr:hypothetical protein [Theionarchaea archaeon]